MIQGASRAIFLKVKSQPSALRKCFVPAVLLVVIVNASGFIPKLYGQDVRPNSIEFTNVTAAAGVKFVHLKGNKGISINREEFGPGVCVTDFDDDGWQDIYFVNGRDLYNRGISVSNALYRNNGDGTFTDVTPQGEWIDLDIDLTKPHHEEGWKWTSGVQVSARIDRAAKTWYAAMRIPFAAIDRRQPADGNLFRINLFRTEGPPSRRTHIVWQPTMSDGFHVPESFGILKLVSNPAR